MLKSCNMSRTLVKSCGIHLSRGDDVFRPSLTLQQVDLVALILQPAADVLVMETEFSQLQRRSKA